jgi:hypothetical protein
MFLSGETLFPSGSNYVSVPYQSRSAVMIESGNAQYI